MKQQCHITFVYGSWLVILGGLVFSIMQGNILQAIFWPAFIALFLLLYVRYFPSLSGFMGYGSVKDEPATEIRPSTSRVILYTGIGCPFCPIVKTRLQELQPRMGFELAEKDVTLRPDVLVAKGIRALPVVEVGTAHWVGNATSEQLAAFTSTNATAGGAA